MINNQLHILIMKLMIQTLLLQQYLRWTVSLTLLMLEMEYSGLLIT